MSYALLLLAVQHCISSFAAPYGDRRGGYERVADHVCGELAAVGLVVEPLLRAERAGGGGLGCNTAGGHLPPLIGWPQPAQAPSFHCVLEPFFWSPSGGDGWGGPDACRALTLAASPS